MRLSGAGGLLVVALPACKSKPGKSEGAGESQAATTDALSKASAATTKAPPVAAAGGGQLSAWVHVADNDVITYFVPEAEMGQGVHTAVAMVISAELGGAWHNAVATTAPLNPVFGRQSTGGSTSIRTGFDAFRLVGATARALLIQAGAEHMQVPPAECEAVDSKVVWKGGQKSVGFGAIATKASEIENPATPILRSEISLGVPTLRLDSFAKVTGQAIYGMDVRQPGMLIGKAAHIPSLGATPTSVDDSAARQVEGVREVVRTPAGVVVLAEHTWAAMKGRDALRVEWKESNVELSNATIDAKLRAALKGGRDAFKSGNVQKHFKGGATMVEAEYAVPYLAHAPMEPLSCTAKVSSDRCDIWTGTQSPSGAAQAAAEITGLAPEQIFVHGHFLGGGFGRRSKADYVAEAVHAAKASGKTVKLLWDREDSMRSFHYRPAALNTLRAAVDAEKGTLLAWEHRIASPSILKQFGPLEGGIDGTSIDGTVKYAPSDMLVRYSDVDLPIPVWFWRSVGHSQNGFVVDAFMNEAAKAAGRDPLEFRLNTRIARLTDEGQLEDDARLRKVLEMVADKAGWGTAPPAGRARGIAASESFGSWCAQVAEVSMEGTRPRVHKVTCVVDCGKTINPKTVEAQMHSGIVYGLSAALYGKLDFDKGRAVQGNFDSYRVLRMSEMPVIDTTIVESSEAHGGIGEPAVPPIAGALAGALYALRGQPVRSLPIL